MAISIADSPGCFPSPPFPFPSMPDPKKATPVKQSVWHRSWLPRWLLRDGRHSASASRSSKRLEWNAHRNDNNSRASNPLPQTAFTDTGAGIHPNVVSNEKVPDSCGYPAPVRLGNRRAVSADRRTTQEVYRTRSLGGVSTSQLSAPEVQWNDNETSNSAQWFDSDSFRFPNPLDSGTYTESVSANGDDLKDILETELDKKWILNLSLRFRNGSDREKFFVTYAETPTRWRRVTVACDYGRAEPASLEHDLKEQPYQSEKNARIYESIRDSICQIQFFDTVTNLRLETIDGQLHVNVTEDANEIISYPPVSTVYPLGSQLIPESLLTFEAHFSGFAYQVKYEGKDYVKKEIPGPESVDEFLYEINALHELRSSENVIQLKAIIVDDAFQSVKGLLLDFAAKGDLAGLLQDYEGEIQWRRRERWAKQIVHGLAEIHEAGFVQGDLTVTNIVVDGNDDAKIIDINRRGCPIGWEPPEFNQKLETKQRISMYIGVKSDVYQLGMILWAIAMEVDQPERHARPLHIPVDVRIPEYYKKLVQTCLSPRPQDRLAAKELLAFFPPEHVSPAPGMASHAQELAIPRSLHSQIQNGHVDLDRIPRSYLEQPADNFQIVSVLDYPENQHYTHRRFSDPYHNNGPVIDPQPLSSNNNHTDDDGWNREISLASPQNISSSEGNRMDGVSLAMGIGSTQATLGPHSGVISSPGSEPSVPILKEPEIDLDIPFGPFSFTNAPGNPGPNPVFELGSCPQDLTFVGSHPSCFLDTHSVTKKEEDCPPQQANGSVEPGAACPESSKGAASDNDTFEMAKEIQDTASNSVCAMDNVDLLSSSLPINPAFMTEILAQQDYVATETDSDSLLRSDKPSNKKCTPHKLRRVTSMTDLNDLFTSHLPINPGVKDREEDALGHPLPVWGSLHTNGELPEPLAPTCSLTGRLFGHPTSPNKYSERENELLFASALPINPAMTTNTIDLDDGNLCNGILLLHELDSTSSSKSNVESTLYTTKLLSKDGNHEEIAIPSSESELLSTSKLPINPAMITEDVVPNHKRLPDAAARSQANTDSSSPSIELFESKLPINPAFIERE